MTHASSKLPLHHFSRHVSAKAAALMTGMSSIITQHKCNEFLRGPATMACILQGGTLLFFCLGLEAKNASSSPPSPPSLCCSTPGAGVAQPAPHHPTRPPPAGSTQPAWRAPLPDCGLCSGSDGAHPAGFYRHVPVEESPAEQHAQ